MAEWTAFDPPFGLCRLEDADNPDRRVVAPFFPSEVDDDRAIMSTANTPVRRSVIEQFHGVENRVIAITLLLRDDYPQVDIGRTDHQCRTLRQMQCVSSLPQSVLSDGEAPRIRLFCHDVVDVLLQRVKIRVQRVGVRNGFQFPTWAEVDLTMLAMSSPEPDWAGFDLVEGKDPVQPDSSWLEFKGYGFSIQESFYSAGKFPEAPPDPITGVA